jgi:FAD-linked sulfhydryl oxidase
MDLEQKGWAWPNVPKQEWGPRGWNWLHLVAINYPPEPSLPDARATFRRIWTFVTRLPCAECRRHASAFVLQHPPDLASTYTLQAWAWNFHNIVNVRLGKPAVSYEDYLRTYANDICRADINNWRRRRHAPA